MRVGCVSLSHSSSLSHQLCVSSSIWWWYCCCWWEWGLVVNLTLIFWSGRGKRKDRREKYIYMDGCLFLFFLCKLLMLSSKIDHSSPCWKTSSKVYLFLSFVRYKDTSGSNVVVWCRVCLLLFDQLLHYYYYYYLFLYKSFRAPLSCWIIYIYTHTHFVSGGFWTWKLFFFSCLYTYLL